MRKSLVALSVLAAASTFPAHAEYLYGFGDMSVNYLDWSNGTEDRAQHQKDFWYLELEGGAGFSWGELYGFADLENADKGSDKARTSVKGTIAYKTGIAELRLYGQVYNTNSDGFTAQNNVVGLSYAFNGDGWFFNPFVGFHHTMTSADWKDPSSFTGMNGGMFGWVAGYNFNAFGEKFMISNWHESEFGRDDKYMIVSGEGDDVSANGALALWWNATDHVTTGVQYRYAYNKLGTKGNQNAVIYSVKYNF
ncbi:outer membrane protein OmpK [Photobacterium leiognathi]|uniref:outer membrane protein OmpK n=1 Tax=Photobacterium leiognathi TaxID=553611 RepID=UPI0027389D95|nr:outer membrane protein OmpK [Photobacterium leiognathi]